MSDILGLDLGPVQVTDLQGYFQIQGMTTVNYAALGVFQSIPANSQRVLIEAVLSGGGTGFIFWDWGSSTLPSPANNPFAGTSLISTWGSDGPLTPLPMSVEVTALPLILTWFEIIVLKDFDFSLLPKPMSPIHIPKCPEVIKHGI